MPAFISKETINAINNTADIVSVVGEYVKLTRKSGNDWWGICPFHNDKNSSFHVDGDKRYYHCFGCGAGGNVINFVMKTENISYVETLKTLAKRSGIEVKYENGGSNSSNIEVDNTIEQMMELYDRTSTTFHYFLMEHPSGKKALEYIKERGLTDETLKKFKLGYAPADKFWLKKFLKSKNYSEDFLAKSGLFSKNYPDLSFFNDRLMFPIFDRNGKVVAFGGRILHPEGPKDAKYMNSRELPHYHKGETLFAFNFAKKSIKTNNKVILCEGYMDCIAYHQCGIDYAVAPLGTAFTEDQIKILRTLTNTVLLSFDSDGAGQNATKKAILICRKYDLTVKVIKLTGGKDPAEIMLTLGKENLTAQVNGAIFDIDYFLNNLGKKYPVGTPDGKRDAANEFFQYVDSIPSNIQKESCLEQLSQTFNLKLEAVKRDYYNHSKNLNKEQKYVVRPENNQEKQKVTELKLDAELRGLIAVMADLDQFRVFRSQVSEDELVNPYAKSLYKILEECFNENAFSIPDVLTKCEDESLTRLITEVISSGVYHSENVGIVIKDTINLIKKNSLEDQRNKILQRIRNYTVITQEDQLQLNALLAKKMELDRKIQSL